MFKSIKMIAAVVLFSGAAFAAGEKVAHPIACENFNEFHDKNGVAIGMCGATKPGGKARVLRSYVVTRVVNPATDKPESIMVGWQ